VKRWLLAVLLAACSHDMTLDVTIHGHGVFEAYGPGATNPDIICDQGSGPCSGKLPAGSTVHILGVPAAGYHFGDFTSTDLTVDPARGDQMIVVGSSAQALTVDFVADPQLSVLITGKGSVTSTAVGPSAIACPPACSSSFPVGSSVTLTATPQAGAKLKSWTATPAIAGLDPMAPSQTITMSQDQLFQVVFEADAVLCAPTDTGVAPPAVTSIDTTGTVCAGGTIQLTGTDLGGAAACAQVNGVEVSAISGGATSLTLTLAPGTPTGDVTINVLTNEGTSTLTSQNLAVASGSIPDVTNLSPAVVPAGGQLTITGTGLDNATVTLVGTTMTYTATLIGDTGTTITANVPSGTAVGSYTVTVTTPCGMSTAASAINVD
jgi:hypothetical protein